eukprot:364233-Chlamydomonas_euryale.AAC.8
MEMAMATVMSLAVGAAPVGVPAGGPAWQLSFQPSCPEHWKNVAQVPSHGLAWMPSKWDWQNASAAQSPCRTRRPASLRMTRAEATW